LKNHVLKDTATQRRRYEVPLLHWSALATRRADLEGAALGTTRNYSVLNPAKRCFVASSPCSRAFMPAALLRINTWFLAAEARRRVLLRQQVDQVTQLPGSDGRRGGSRPNADKDSRTRRRQAAQRCHAAQPGAITYSSNVQRQSQVGFLARDAWLRHNRNTREGCLILLRPGS